MVGEFVGLRIALFPTAPAVKVLGMIYLYLMSADVGARESGGQSS